MAQSLFNEDSDFSIHKYYRRRSIMNKKKRKSLLGGSGYEERTVGKWNSQENKLYLQFLKLNFEALQDFKCRRERKIFKQMSIFVETRTADQCRSHHQKVVCIHKNISNTINYYQQRLKIEEKEKNKYTENIILIKNIQNQERTESILINEEFDFIELEDNRLKITIQIDLMQSY